MFSLLVLILVHPPSILQLNLILRFEKFLNKGKIMHLSSFYSALPRLFIYQLIATLFQVVNDYSSPKLEFFQAKGAVLYPVISYSFVILLYPNGFCNFFNREFLQWMYKPVSNSCFQTFLYIEIVFIRNFCGIGEYCCFLSWLFFLFLDWSGLHVQ